MEIVTSDLLLFFLCYFRSVKKNLFFGSTWICVFDTKWCNESNSFLLPHFFRLKVSEPKIPFLRSKGNGFVRESISAKVTFITMSEGILSKKSYFWSHWIISFQYRKESYKNQYLQKTFGSKHLRTCKIWKFFVYLLIVLICL